jgi:hypothetical protein
VTSQGFEHLRTVEFEDERGHPSAALFQKRAAHIDATSTVRFTVADSDPPE